MTTVTEDRNIYEIIRLHVDQQYKRQNNGSSSKMKTGTLKSKVDVQC